jgi:hypothetical protein
MTEGQDRQKEYAEFLSALEKTGDFFRSTCASLQSAIEHSGLATQESIKEDFVNLSQMIVAYLEKKYENSSAQVSILKLFTYSCATVSVDLDKAEFEKFCEKGFPDGQ